MSAENRLTSIVSYPERGTGGNNRYRGNCSPKLIEDRFFRAGRDLRLHVRQRHDAGCRSFHGNH